MGYRPKDKAEIYRNMSAIRSTDNRTEQALRRKLHRMGFRYRKHYAVLPGRPDIAFIREKVAVFVDGDYWHGRLLRESGMVALQAYFERNRNQSYWISKIQRNVNRDDSVTAALEQEGWLVMRFWESDLKKDITTAAELVAETLRSRRAELDLLHS